MGSKCTTAPKEHRITIVQQNSHSFDSNPLPNNLEQSFEQYDTTVLDTLDENQLKKALSTCLKLIEKHPNKATVYYHIAMIATKQSQYDKALALFRKSLKINDNSAECHYQIAVLLMDQSQYDEAEQHLDQATKICPLPENNIYWTKLVQLQMRQIHQMREMPCGLVYQISDPMQHDMIQILSPLANEDIKDNELLDKQKATNKKGVLDGMKNWINKRGNKDKQKNKKADKQKITCNDHPEFYCPITMDIMADPVIIADGTTYERSAIQKWFQNNDTSPNTGLKLQHKNLVTNFALKSMIQKNWAK